jgi:hypothetical protein
MALVNIGIVNAPAFVGATGVACHSPAQLAQIKRKWQLHRCRNEALRVAAPSLTTGNGTAAVRADRPVIAAIYEAANRGDILKCISVVSADLEHAAVKTEVGILTGRLEVKVMPEC